MVETDTDIHYRTYFPGNSTDETFSPPEWCNWFITISDATLADCIQNTIWWSYPAEGEYYGPLDKSQYEYAISQPIHTYVGIKWNQTNDILFDPSAVFDNLNSIDSTINPQSAFRFLDGVYAPHFFGVDDKPKYDFVPFPKLGYEDYDSTYWNRVNHANFPTSVCQTDASMWHERALESYLPDAFVNINFNNYDFKDVVLDGVQLCLPTCRRNRDVVDDNFFDCDFTQEYRWENWLATNETNLGPTFGTYIDSGCDYGTDNMEYDPQNAQKFQDITNLKLANGGQQTIVIGKAYTSIVRKYSGAFYTLDKGQTWKRIQYNWQDHCINDIGPLPLTTIPYDGYVTFSGSTFYVLATWGTNCPNTLTSYSVYVGSIDGQNVTWDTLSLPGSESANYCKDRLSLLIKENGDIEGYVVVPYDGQNPSIFIRQGDSYVKVYDIEDSSEYDHNFMGPLVITRIDGSRWFIVPKKGLLLSNDNGLTWTYYWPNISSDALGVASNTIVVRDPHVDVSREHHLQEDIKQLRFSRDNGLSWQTISNEIKERMFGHSVLDTPFYETPGAYILAHYGTSFSMPGNENWFGANLNKDVVIQTKEGQIFTSVFDFIADTIDKEYTTEYIDMGVGLYRGKDSYNVFPDRRMTYEKVMPITHHQLWCFDKQDEIHYECSNPDTPTCFKSRFEHDVIQTVYRQRIILDAYQNEIRQNETFRLIIVANKVWIIVRKIVAYILNIILLVVHCQS